MDYSKIENETLIMDFATSVLIAQNYLCDANTQEFKKEITRQTKIKQEILKRMKVKQ